MREDFLHFLWKYKKFDTSDLYTTNHEPVIIVNSGLYHQLAGPDFFNAQLIIGTQKWAGNIEFHLKSSDWYAHQHETDKAYENVILHVVWTHDTDIYRRDNSEIPVLELKHFVAPATIENFVALTSPKSWIYCERQLENFDDFILRNWLERLFFERLQKKSDPIKVLLEKTRQDWEAVLFCMIAKNFGLNTNGEAFFSIASQIPFSVIRKESANLLNLESLLFGYANLLDGEIQDNYPLQLAELFSVLRQKHRLTDPAPLTVEFFKHRPDNFPTIRLSQLAMLYSGPNLFSSMLEAVTIQDYYKLFSVEASPYWNSHFRFDKESPPTRKALTRSFIDLLVSNTVVPIRFAYNAAQGRDSSESLMLLMNQIKPESNAIIQKFIRLGLIPKNAFESQALLQLKNEYCNRGRCLSCAIGSELLKSPTAQNV